MSREVSNGAILECVIRGLSDDQVTLSYFHYRLNNAVADSDGTALVNSFDGLFNSVGNVADRYLDCCSEDWLFTDVTYQWIYPTRFTFQRKDPFDVAGHVAEPMMPSNTAVALTKRTFLAGRTQRGTLHMPGVPTTFVLNSRVQPAGVTAYEALGDSIDNILTLATDEVFEPLIFHRALPNTSVQIQEVDSQHFVRIMRRRTVGVGE